MSQADSKGTSHTPESWTYERPFMGDIFHVLAADGDTIVARVRDEANARLIASAPELLEACKRVLLECPGIWNTCQTTGETFGFMLDEAIAKAEGR